MAHDTTAPHPFSTRSLIVYEGPSQLDGAPIVAVATGLRASSGNTKTGSMIQTWIMRADMRPADALRTGADASICGDCPLRGALGRGRACYVRMDAPASVYRAYRRGSYRHATPAELTAMQGRPLRLGSYGDPVAVPIEVWRSIAGPRRHTGYTHQWRTVHAQPYRDLLMASADDDGASQLAMAIGWRYFRVRPDATIGEGEILCPAARAERPLQCADCGACRGAGRGYSITIPAHGPGARFF